MEVTKALEALQPLYTQDNVELILEDGTTVRGTVRSMKSEALSRPGVQMEVENGEIIKVAFDNITEIIDHNQPADDSATTLEDDNLTGQLIAI